MPICLLAALTGWTIIHYHPRTNVGNSAAEVAESAAPVVEALARSSSPPAPLGRTLRPFAAELPNLGFDVLPADEEAALANPESPRNSQDSDQNRDWARTHPAEALAWLRNAPDGPQRDTVAEIVCPQLALTDPSQAVAVAEHCAPSGTNLMENVLDNLAQLWAERDEPAAFAWAAAKPQGNDRDRLFERIAFVQSTTDPVNAARMVAEQISPGETQEEAAMSVVHQWAMQNPDAALAWAQSFPAGGIRDRAIQEVENVKAFASAGQSAF